MMPTFPSLRYVQRTKLLWHGHLFRFLNKNKSSAFFFTSNMLEILQLLKEPGLQQDNPR